MSSQAGNKLVIAISSRALFDLDESHLVYQQEGLKADGMLTINNTFCLFKKPLIIVKQEQ